MEREPECVIAELEERLEKAKTALEYCALEAVETEKKAFVACQALAAVWPAPRVIEVGGVYSPKTGSPCECVCIRDGLAYMLPTISDRCPAYVWDIYGKSISFSTGYDIDWSRS